MYNRFNEEKHREPESEQDSLLLDTSMLLTKVVRAQQSENKRNNTIFKARLEIRHAQVALETARSGMHKDLKVSLDEKETSKLLSCSVPDDENPEKMLMQQMNRTNRLQSIAEREERMRQKEIFKAQRRLQQAEHNLALLKNIPIELRSPKITS